MSRTQGTAQCVLEKCGLFSVYYSPQLHRFISADGTINANKDILGDNLFAYCSNNPINNCKVFGFSDPIASSDELDLRSLDNIRTAPKILYTIVSIIY